MPMLVHVLSYVQLLQLVRVIIFSIMLHGSVLLSFVNLWSLCCLVVVTAFVGDSQLQW